MINTEVSIISKTSTSGFPFRGFMNADDLGDDFYKNPAKSIRAILEGLDAGKIGWSHAMNLVKLLPSPWMTPEWKTLRASRLDCKCGRCGYTGKGLVIQHLEHPEKFYDIVESVCKEWAVLYKLKKPAPVKLKDEDLMSGIWGYFSWNEFTALREWRDSMKKEWSIQIYTEAAKRSMLQTIRYTELHTDDIVTRCTSCAYVEDRANGKTHGHQRQGFRNQAKNHLNSISR